MKTYLCLSLAAVLISGAVHAASPVTESNAWTETYTVRGAAPRLEVSNIWGSVRVRTGEAGEIAVFITEVRSAPDQRRFDRSMDAIQLSIDANTMGLSMMVGDPHDRWNGLNRCDGCRVDYQFEIAVPVDAVVDVATVMDGNVDVRGVGGTVSASNVNGPVSVTGIRNCDRISSVNGRVDIAFSEVPERNCTIETINGDITLNVPADASLDVAMDLFNGDITSEFPVGPFALPATVEHTKEDGRNRYRIRQVSGIRIGAGGPMYSIASMNGDVRILKRQ